MPFRILQDASGLCAGVIPDWLERSSRRGLVGECAGHKAGSARRNHLNCERLAKLFVAALLSNSRVLPSIFEGARLVGFATVLPCSRSGSFRALSGVLPRRTLDRLPPARLLPRLGADLSRLTRVARFPHPHSFDSEFVVTRLVTRGSNLSGFRMTPAECGTMHLSEH